MVPRKLVEAFFRSLWILILPVVLVPALVIILVDEEPSYVSEATVWVTRADELEATALTANANPYLTPAQNQVLVFQDLLSTRAFRIDVAIDARLVEPAAPESELTLAANEVGRSIGVSALGTNLVGLEARAATPEEAIALLAAILRQYQVRSAEETGRQTTIAESYYREQLDIANAELEKRQGDVTAYLAENPRLINSLEAREADAQYVRLAGRVERQAEVVDNLHTALQEVQLKAKSAPQSQEAIFSVQDAPSFPDAPASASLMSKVGYPFAGMVFGLLIAASYLYLTYRADQTIRAHSDLEGLGVPLLGYVPELRKGPGAGLWQYTPFAWLLRQRSRSYARRVAASIAAGTARGF